MNNLINITNKDGKLTVSSREVAERFEKRHDHVVRDVESIIKQGCPQNWGDLFIEAEYQNAQNKQYYKQYELTRDGFSLLAMGFTGAKALEWKLKFIEAFNKMEETIKTGALPQSKTKRPALGSINVAVKNIMTVYNAAGVDPRFTATAVTKLYEEMADIKLIPPIQEDPTEMIYDKTNIAKLLGVLSAASLPHPSAIGAIITKLDISDDEKVKVPYDRHGHSGFDYQYKPSVVDKVKRWLEENNFPPKIEGCGKSYTVKYSQAA